jgi:cation:H+ antiporter
MDMQTTHCNHAEFPIEKRREALRPPVFPDAGSVNRPPVVDNGAAGATSGGHLSPGRTDLPLRRGAAAGMRTADLPVFLSISQSHGPTITRRFSNGMSFADFSSLKQRHRFFHGTARLLWIHFLHQQRRQTMWLQVVLLIVGFAMLYYGAEWLVKGSANLARSLGVTPIVIGLTVVAFGTSAPELVVSVISSISDKSMIAVGNVVGSNICNIALVLGAAAFLMPLTADRSVIRRDIPLMLAISLYLLILSFDSHISRFEGATLFGGIIAYTIFNYYISARETRLAAKPEGGSNAPGIFSATAPAHAMGVQGGAAALETPAQALGLDTHVEVEHARELLSEAEAEIEDIGIIESRPKQIALIVVGIAGVVIGAQVLIDAAVVIMKTFGVSEKFIGLTIVALGTSLPELATSIVAALRKEMDISIGNLVGSNVFNIMSVIGAAALVRPIAIPGGFFESGLIYDYLMMMFVSLLPLLLMFKDSTIRRSGGFLLLCCYVGYMGYLIYMG